MIAGAAASNPLWFYAGASILAGIVLAFLGFVAQTLLKHAQILASITTTLPPMLTTLSQLQGQMNSVQLEQMRVATELAVSKATNDAGIRHGQPASWHGESSS